MKKFILPIICIGALAFMPNLNAESVIDPNSETGLNKYVETSGQEQITPGHLDISDTIQIGQEIKPLAYNPGIQPNYFTSQMYVTPIQQDTTYYCGYAAVEEIVTYLNGSSNSQYSYASELGHPTSAVNLSEIIYLLNKYTDKTYQSIAGQNVTLSSFVTMIENSVTNDKPVVVFATTTPLAMYNGKTLYHYIVATGYTLSAVEEWNRRIFYVDSWYQNYGNGSVFGTHLDTKQNVYATFSGDTVQSLAY